MVTETSLDKLTGVQINALTGYLVAMPFAFAIVATVLWARHSDITHERVWHAALPEMICGLSLIAAAYLGNPILAAVALTIASMGTISSVAPSGPCRPAFSLGSAAAGGIAWISSIGNLGGFAGPYAIGWIKDATGEVTLGLVVLAAGPIMSGLIVILMGHDSKMEMAGSRFMAK